MRYFFSAILIASLSALPFAEAGAQERVVSREHTGSLGLMVGIAPEYSGTVKSTCLFCGGGQSISTLSPMLELGGSMAIGNEGNELTLRARITRFSDAAGESLLLGYRNYFGRDEFKTFASLDLQAAFRPVQTLGARAAFGIMYDFSPTMGVWVDVGGSFGIGRGRRFGAEVLFGFQARSYLLE